MQGDLTQIAWFFSVIFSCNLPLFLYRFGCQCVAESQKALHILNEDSMLFEFAEHSRAIVKFFEKI